MRNRIATFFVLSATMLIGLAEQANAQRRLSAAQPIRVDGVPIDVKRYGAAAPAVMDFDADGTDDLLVGEGFNGQLRVYLNSGDNNRRRLAEHFVFQDGLPEGRVPSNYGFCPHVVDLDGDGLQDIITPAWHGQIYWFRQTSPGKFGRGTPVRNSHGRVINTRWTFGATSCDWDADGYPDIVFSMQDFKKTSNLYLVRNSAEPAEPRFENPVSVTAGGKPIYIQTDAPAPIAADWDRDGLFDLLVGTSEGQVLLLRNSGTPQTPKFGEPSELIPSPTEGSERGGNARLCVVDWNSDGRLDILLGDTGERFDEALTEEEVTAKKAAADQRRNAFANWADVYRLYLKLKGSSVGKTDLAVARERMVQLTREQDLAQVRYRSIFDERRRHGRVWLFLGVD